MCIFSPQSTRPPPTSFPPPSTSQTPQQQHVAAPDGNSSSSARGYSVTNVNTATGPIASPLDAHYQAVPSAAAYSEVDSSAMYMQRPSVRQTDTPTGEATAATEGSSSTIRDLAEFTGGSGFWDDLTQGSEAEVPREDEAVG